jgi:frataxin
MLPRTSRAVTSAVPSLRLYRPAVSTTSPAALQLQLKQSLTAVSSYSSQGQPLRRAFHSTPAVRKGITPGSSDPPSPNPQSNRVADGAIHVTEPSPLTDSQYHEYSEHYFNVLLGEIERIQEEGADLEAEYSVCQEHDPLSSCTPEKRLLLRRVLS